MGRVVCARDAAYARSNASIVSHLTLADGSLTSWADSSWLDMMSVRTPSAATLSPAVPRTPTASSRRNEKPP